MDRVDDVTMEELFWLLVLHILHSFKSAGLRNVHVPQAHPSTVKQEEEVLKEAISPSLGLPESNAVENGLSDQESRHA